MLVRIYYRLVASDDLRRAIRYAQGRDGLATSDEVREWALAHLASSEADALWQWEDREE